MSNSVTPWTAAHQASLSFTISRSWLKLVSIELVMSSNCIILCHSLLIRPSLFLSIRVFSNESAPFIICPKYWSFSFSISPSNECSGLISFRIDWCDVLAVQGTLKSLLQHHSTKASILQCSSSFLVQLSHVKHLLGLVSNVIQESTCSIATLCQLQQRLQIRLRGLHYPCAT